MVEGKLQIEGEVIHVVASKCYNMNGLLRDLTEIEQEQPIAPVCRADEDGELYDRKDTRIQKQKVIQGEIFPGGRNFR